MKKSKLNGCVLKLDWLNADASLFIGTHEEMIKWYSSIGSKKGIKRLLKNIEDNPITEEISARTYFPSGSRTLTWLPKRELSGLAHETFHTVWHILSMKDIPLSNDTEEVYAYLYDYVFSTFYRFMKHGKSKV